ncbi:MAG: Crp/Fnr family transcriptional regulator [Acidobacteriota bacterium]
MTTTLTRIQKVVYLQAVDLFTYCNAEQMMRIAGIARQRNLAAGERVYSINDPAEGMACVVEGTVQLRNTDGEVRRIGTRETFGVYEILSDRLRREDAWAESATVALVIDAEDFFDLLSNNVEIVKALFRQLLRRNETSERFDATKAPQLATG